MSGSRKDFNPIKEPENDLHEGFTIVVDPRWVGGTLLLAACGIVLVGFLAHVVTYHVLPDQEHKLAKLMNRFDLVNEPSLPSWYSSLTLMACSTLLFVIALAKKRQKAPYVLHWFGLSLMFLLFSADEAIMLHEMLVNPFKDLLNAGGILSITWVVPGGAFVLAVGIFYLKFLQHLDRKSRWLFVAAGSIFVFGALGMELPGGVLYEKYGFTTLHYISSYAIEEFLEMAGIALFIFALLDYVDRNIGSVRMRILTSRQRLLAAESANTSVGSTAPDIHHQRSRG